MINRVVKREKQSSAAEIYIHDCFFDEKFYLEGYQTAIEIKQYACHLS